MFSLWHRPIKLVAGHLALRRRLDLSWRSRESAVDTYHHVKHVFFSILYDMNVVSLETRMLLADATDIPIHPRSRSKFKEAVTRFGCTI